jgi:predicted nucleotidyltransferase
MDRQRLEKIAHAHDIVLLLQFGSSVTGRTHARSDVDLAVLLARAPESLGEQADLVSDLQQLFPDRDVDVAVLNHADPLLLKQVADHGVLLLGSPRHVQEFKLYAFKRHQDHQRFFQLEREYVDRAVTARRR